MKRENGDGAAFARRRKEEGEAVHTDEKMEADRTLQVVKGGGHKKRPRSELQAVDAGAAPATTNAQQNKKDKGNKRRKTGGKKGSSKKADAKQDKLKVGGGLELLDAELLGAEEQATFFQAQYRTADPTLIISAGQALPLGTPKNQISRDYFILYYFI
jgi:hypothetical protein